MAVVARVGLVSFVVRMAVLVGAAVAASVVGMWKGLIFLCLRLTCLHT